MASSRFTPIEFPGAAPPEAVQEGAEWLGELSDLDPDAAEEKAEAPFRPGLDLPTLPAEDPGGNRREEAPEPSEAADGDGSPGEAAGSGEDEAPEGAAPLSADPEELERLREEARQEGYQAGLLEGREKGEAEGREAMERVKATFLDSFEQAVRTLTEGEPEREVNWREPLEKVVRAICERILRASLDEDLTGYLERLVTAGLEELDAGKEIQVILGDVTPGVVEELRERLAKIPGAGNLRLHMEPEYPGDFVRIETDYGIIQTSLDSQLDRVVKEVLPAAAGQS